ncbi:amidase family protein [Dactylosporangium sp. AC04546]|uniref:amidase family protein n=1 Tax=Dactylosporangium sp. AC04546 TaxID=2862460 RepID=UPI001EDFE770|nr:amidase family protein [Dactylosporangium sp. AC04546]WVK81318.1 amidase family protein [Dactylosporangium sp. AC04546]
MTAAHWWPAGRVAAAIAGGELSAAEYLDLLLDRVARLDPGLELLVTVDDTARDRARAADRAVARGEPLGPLHGVALTVKDSLATAGLRTTAGSALRRDHVPAADARAVTALRRAGAIVFGKTNLPEHCADIQARSVYGVSRNPWDPAYSTGGSSGGGAGAVAAGLTPVEVGSDVAGSIRIPAGYCGVAGHKPTYGIVPLDGHLPPYHPTTPDVVVVGPLARTVDDLELMLGVLSGPGGRDGSAWRLDLPPARPVRRIALWTGDPAVPTDPEIVAVLHDVAERLGKEGVAVEEDAPPGVRLADASRIADRLLAGVGVPLRGAHDRAALGGAHAGQSYADWYDADVARWRLAARWERFFARYDAILTPVTPNLAIVHDGRPFAERRVLVGGAERPYWDQVAWATLTGVCHLPTTVVPAALDSRGLPIGVAFSGPRFGDLTTLAAARLVPPIGHPPC